MRMSMRMTERRRWDDEWDDEWENEWENEWEDEWENEKEHSLWLPHLCRRILFRHSVLVVPDSQSLGNLVSRSVNEIYRR